MRRLHAGELPIPNVEYFWNRTEGWLWNGTERWWEVFVVFCGGVNGGGGACIEERWRWNGSSQNLRVQPRNLSLQETRQLFKELAETGDVHNGRDDLTVNRSPLSA